MMEFIKGEFTGFDCGITTWDEPRVRMYKGKKVVGRPTRGFGDSPFNYAGKLYEPEPWTTPMTAIKLNAEYLVSEKLKKKVKFNFCLCGYYGPEGKGIPHHSDTVPTKNDIVLSVSLGAPRVFEWLEYEKNIKDRVDTSEIDTKYIPKKSLTHYLMEDGDVFIFDGKSQMRSTHAVLDMKGCGERINLTFRSGV